MVLDNLGTLTKALVALVVLMAVGFLIVANVASNASVAADGNASAAVSTLQTAMAGIPGWVPLIVIATIGIVLLALTKGLR